MILSAVFLSYLGSHQCRALAVSAVQSGYSEELLSPRSSEDKIFDDRSVLGILWSCLSTLFLCSWVAVHPDIPPPGRTKWQTFTARLKMMLYLLLFPELVIWWAARQHFDAKFVMKKQNIQGNGHNWTMAHAFFYSMGGFSLQLSDDATPIKLRRLIDNVHQDAEGSFQCGDKLIDWPALSEEEIMDRSKADVLSKGIALIQTSWFIAQCISRIVFKISITELEVVTLAFATLNVIVYFLWWHKPCDVRFGIRLFLKQEETRRHGRRPHASSRIYASRERTHASRTLATPSTPPRSYPPPDNSNPAFKPLPAVRPSRTRVPFQTHALPHTAVLPPSIPRTHRLTRSDLSFQSSRHQPPQSRPPFAPAFYNREYESVPLPDRPSNRLRSLGSICRRCIVSVLVAVFEAMATFATGLYEMAEGTGDFSSEGTYARRGITTLVVVVTFVFGAIHFVGWSYDFPTLREQRLWRLATISICGVPICAPHMMLMVLDGDWRPMTWAKPVVRPFGVFLLVSCSIVYLGSRLILLILPFVSLRALPPSALVELKWTTLFPHI